MTTPTFDFPDSYWSDINKLGINKDKAEMFSRYLVDRVRHKDYRGEHLGQQNRTHMEYEKLRAILESIHQVQQKSPLNALWVPVGDDIQSHKDKARVANDIAFQEYLKFVSTVRKETSVGGNNGSGTYNSVKKNWFPDLERMGLIDLQRIPSCSSFKALTLAKRGTDILEAQSFQAGYCAFSGAIDALIGDQVLPVLVHILWNNRSEFDKITLAEYQFIVSDKRIGISADHKMELIRGYRALRRKHKIFIEDYLDRWAIDHKNKIIDFGNWRNQAQQSFKVFNASQYFRNFNGEYLTLAMHEGDMLEAFRRASNVRIDYLREHSVGPRCNFEFHHVIPFSMITTKKELAEIDTWKNLIYIDKQAHRKVPATSNSYLRLGNVPGWQLAHFLNTDQVISIQQSEIQVSANPAVIAKVLKYNAKLLDQLS